MCVPAKQRKESKGDDQSWGIGGERGKRWVAGVEKQVPPEQWCSVGAEVGTGVGEPEGALEGVAVGAEEDGAWVGD